MSMEGAHDEPNGTQATNGDIEVLREEWRCLGSGAKQLFMREWRSNEAKPKAVIALVHGQGEHGDRYAHVAKQWAAAGFVFVAMDIYGHGQSEGKRGHMLSMSAILDDVMLMLEQCGKRYSGLPAFLYGHSMGGNIALNCALRLKPDIQGLMITSPWLQLAFKTPAVKEWIGRRVASILPSLPMSTGLKQDDMFRKNSDDAWGPAKIDDLCHSVITPRAYVEIQAAGEWVSKHIGDLHVPLLLMHGSEDRVTSFQASRNLAEKLGNRCDWMPWDGGLHELHNDVDGKLTVKTMMDWVARQL